MCGRFSLYAEKDELIERFAIEDYEAAEWTERYNIAPSQPILAIVGTADGNRAGMLKWGLVPFWAKDPKIGSKMINARAETVDEKPSFKRLLERRRCLIIADGFYEWKKEEKGKQPFRFTLKTKESFAFAGLWDSWDKGGDTLHTCTIITTEANSLMKPVHDRMPVMLTPGSEKIWLDRTEADSAVLKKLLVPFPSEEMEAYPVSPLVNSPKNDSADILNSL